MAQTDTVTRILETAGSLFAERGYAETSLRTITSAANVNLAAVNYHFGSKKALIQAVFARFLTPFCDELSARLDELNSCTEPTQPDLERLITILFDSLLASMEKLGESPEQFMRLLGLAYTQSQEHLRHFILSEYGSYYRRYTARLAGALPAELNPVEFYWRLYFMLGASVFTLSSYQSINGILKAESGTETSIKGTVEMLIPAVTRLLDSESTHRGRS